jgi:hypothetical protein
MLKGLNYHVKNRLLGVAAVLLAVLCWNLAFKKTFDSIVLNRELNRKTDQKNDLSVNTHFLKQKQEIIRKALNQYTLDSAEWRNEFWLKVSRAAASKGVGINYNPLAQRPLSDSVSSIARQEITFRGDFKRLVTLLDSLEKAGAVGFVSSSRFRKEKKLNIAGPENLYLNTSFSILQNAKE